MNTQGAFLALWQLGIAFLIGFGVGAAVVWLIDVGIKRWYRPAPTVRGAAAE